MNELRSAQQSSRDLSSLPSPLVIYAAVTESDHFHIGLPGARRSSLRAALDRTCFLATERLGPRSCVLDVGCGPGGTTALLASRGHRVVGIDPCRRSVAHAARLPMNRHATFRATRFEQLDAWLEPESFDALVAVEVLQHFRDLDGWWARVRGQLRPGGLLFVSDLFAVPRLEWSSVPFHTCDDMVTSARRNGCVPLEESEHSDVARSWLVALMMGLDAARARLRHTFDPRRDLDAEVDELRNQLDNLNTAFTNGDLYYRQLVFRRER